jgi:hypothetical protein
MYTAASQMIAGKFSELKAAIREGR